ncbi:MAG: hypothetical protein WHT06_16215 [Desulfobacterales bacterium]
MAITLKNKNFAMSRLASAITNSATSLEVLTGQGALFPSSGQFRAVIWSASYDSPVKDANREIVTLQLSSGDTFTATRGQEGTTARSWSANDYVAHVITAGKIDEIEAEVNAKADSSSVTSALAGKADKVSGATANRVAKLDSNGNLAQAGFLDSDVVVKTGSPSLGDGLVFNGSLWVPTPTSNPNLLINGGLQIWQRNFNPNVTISNAGASFTADRFIVLFSANGGAIKYTKDTGPSNFPAVAIECATAKTSLAGADFLSFDYRLEGYDFAHICGRNAVLSFWVKSTLAGTYYASFYVSGSSALSYVAPFVVNSTNTWEYKQISFPVTTSGSPDLTTEIGMVIRLCLASGSDYHTSTFYSWLNGNKLCGSNQVNLFSSTSNKCWFAMLKLELGNVATPFSPVSIQQEYAKCCRYYEKSYLHNANPGSVTDSGRCIGTAVINNDYFHQAFSVRKRAAPTIVLYSPTTGTSGVYRNASTGADQAPSSTASSETSFSFSSVASAGHIIVFQWAANAEM